MKKLNTNNTISPSREPDSKSDDGVSLKRKARSGRLQLMKFEDLPEYLKDNEYIRSYYRCEWPLKDAFLSIFSLHNETFNIWTHLVGLIIFVVMLVMSLNGKTSPSLVEYRWLMPQMMNQFNGSDGLFMGSLGESKVPDSVPIWPWLVFLLGAMSCLSFSSVSHLLACHSQPYYCFLWSLDYAGIAVMIVCSFFAPIYYIFSEHPFWRFFYLSAITSVGILVIVFLFAPDLSSGRYRSFRAILFLCMGFSGVIPAVHAMILHWGQPQVLVTIAYEIAMGLLYAIGAFFYVSRIPERWRPGAFDIVGQSHQIFHILVVAAALTHGVACLRIIEWQRGLSA